MNALTPGEQAVWAARFNQAQVDIMGEMQVRHEQRNRPDHEGRKAAPTQEQAMEWLGEATRIAIDQAHNAVAILRRIRPPEGEAGEMLAGILGPTPAPLPAPLEGLVGPWDMQTLPPPGMMFPDGRSDVVCPVLNPMAPPDLAQPWPTLAAAWEMHLRAADPPGYKTGRVDFGGHSLRINYVRLLSVDQILKQCEVAYDPFGGEPPTPEDERKASEEVRAYAWRCFQQPHHVSFWARFGDRVGARLDTVLGWSEEQLQAAWRYLQERAAWQAKAPTTPDFWPSEE